MRYFYIVFEGPGIKVGMFYRGPNHPLVTAELTGLQTNIARQVSLRGMALVQPEQIQVVFFQELPADVAADRWPQDFAPLVTT